MKDIMIVATFFVLFAVTVYERLTFGAASGFLIFPTLVLFPLVIMSSKDILNRSKNKLKRL